MQAAAKRLRRQFPKSRVAQQLASILVPPARTPLDDLIAAGQARPAQRPKQRLSPEDLIPVQGSVSDLVIEDRGH
jgi:hypothetical protein